MNCLQEFREVRSRDEHVIYCRNNELVRIEMPHGKPIARYSKGQYQFKVPFIMYADFESIIEPIEGPGNNPVKSSTRGVNVHTPSGWCIRSEFAYGNVKNPVAQYRGANCVQRFCEHIVTEAQCLYRSYPEKPMDPLTKAQMKEHSRASTCHICFGPFKSSDRKVRDHCHHSSKYRGAAHSLCNLQYKIPSYIPAVLHNISGCDVHLFISKLSKYGSKMGVIGKNTDDHISFSLKIEVGVRIDKARVERPIEIDLRFIDSTRFMCSSLDSPVNNLTRGEGGNLFGFEEYSKHQASLLARKGIYPYEYMDSWDRFNETDLPPVSCFYSKLNMSGVSDDDYEHARKVWREFGIQNMGEYHDLYLRTDVILLANVFEAFR